MERHVRIVLQARTTSSRLPGKSLLPIGGMPLSVLCARRLGATGIDVQFATSEDPVDDLLARIAEEAGLKVFRGSLNNVLDRFIQCISDLGDDDIVVRATADNPLPDGRFIEALVQRFSAAPRDYFATTSPDDGLPYGLSAEVFSAGALRRVAGGTPDALDFENVTTTLRRKAGAEGIVAKYAFFAQDLSRLRVTIDTLDDYLAIAGLFAELSIPVEEDWKALVQKFAARQATTKSARPAPSPAHGHCSMALGTVQLGEEKYGAANTTGRPGDAEAAEMLALALRAGFTHIDTAPVYGDAEARIGSLLPARVAATVKIVTKLKPLDAIPDDAPQREVRAAVDASVYRSCRELRRDRIDVLLFHRSADMFRWQGAAFARIVELAAAGVVGALGVSVYSPEEAIECLVNKRITYVQLPFNLLDARWLGGAFASALANRGDVQIQVRSVFLQGILVNDSACWPPSFAERQELPARIDALSRKFARKGRADLCMAYVRSFPWVTTLVLGAETLRQLEQLVALATEPALTTEQVREVQATFAGVPDRLLNPSKWAA